MADRLIRFGLIVAAVSGFFWLKGPAANSQQLVFRVVTPIAGLLIAGVGAILKMKRDGNA